MFTHTTIIYYLLTESEVIKGKSQTEALMYWPSDSEVNTSRPRLIGCLLYGLFSTILKKNTIKTSEVIFHIRLRALWFSSSLILKKYLYASFSFSYWKYSCTLYILFVVFAHALVALLKTQKSRWAEKNIHNARSLQENNAAQQPIRVHVVL